MRLIKREERESLERELLSPEATLSSESKGRAVEEEPDEYRTAFERDRDRILHSKALKMYNCFYIQNMITIYLKISERTK